MGQEVSHPSQNLKRQSSITHQNPSVKILHNMEDHCCIPPSRAKYKPVNHVIFDLDGTILNTEAISTDAIAEVAGKHGKSLTPEIRQKLDGTTAKDKANLAVELMDLPMSPEEFLNATRDICSPKWPKCELMPGAEMLITHFHDHDVPMAIASSTTQESFDAKTQNYKELFALFHHVVCGGTDPEVTNGKPCPDIFLICADRFASHPRPRDCLVIEDAPNGVEAALAAGMQVVMVPRDYVPYEVWNTATLRLDTLEFIMPELFGLPRLPREIADETVSQFSDIPEAAS